MYQKNTIKTKCSFCKYYSGRSCMATPNSRYCKEASDEYYQYLHSNKAQTAQKSLRAWDKNR